MAGFAHISPFIYTVFSVHNSIIIMVINVITVICVLESCNWLFRICAQKLGSWAGEWKKVADACKIKTNFCWQICSPWIWFLGVWRIFTFDPQELSVVKLVSHWCDRRKCWEHLRTFCHKILPRTFGETDTGSPALVNVQTWSLGNRGFEITSQSSTGLIFKEKNKATVCNTICM